MSWRSDIVLNQHQRDPARYMACSEGSRALMLFYSVGSGKTFTGLYTIDKLYEFWKHENPNEAFPKILIIAPAKVTEEIWKREIQRLGFPVESFTIMSYDLLRNHYQKIAGEFREIRRKRQESPRGESRHCVLIADECHVVRTTSTGAFHALFAVAAEMDKVLLLTGTPMINSVEDLQAPLRIITDNVHATVPENYFVNKKELELIHTKDFLNLFSGKVLSHIVPPDNTDYPTVDRTVHRVNMYELQRIRYDEFDKELLTPALRELMNKGIITTALNSFLTRTRAISNTVGKFALPGEEDTPELSEKFKGIKKHLIHDPKPIVVYSFYRENGVLPLKQFIDRTTDLKTELLSGETNVKEVKRILKAYNVDRKIDVLFMTSAFRQGITLLGTRSGHIMEPSWTESLEEQVIGRFARYQSHAHLPPEFRHVMIHFWITRIKGRKTSTDEYIFDFAQRKMEMIGKFEELLTQVKLPKLCKSYGTH